MMPDPALSDPYSAPVALPFGGPASTPEFFKLLPSAPCAPVIFLVEPTGKARPTIEGRALCELGMWRRIGGVPSRT